MVIHLFNFYPDELFYSACARYNIWSLNKSIKHTVFDLFGEYYKSAEVYFPTGLQLFCNRLPEDSLSPNDIIDYHTLFPLFQPFLSEDRVKKIRDIMIFGESDGGILFQIGVVSSLIQVANYLRFCPDCATNDIKEYGEAYWHRSHQVTGVNACYQHGIGLLESTVSVTSRQNKSKFVDISDSLFELGTANTSSFVSKHELEIAKAVNWLLNNKVSQLNYEGFKVRYIELLKGMGLATLSGVVKQKKLAEKFNFFSVVPF